MKGCLPSSSIPCRFTESKKALPPVLPLGTNRRGISQGSLEEWRAVYQSLSEVVPSSDMPRHTDVPGTLAASPIFASGFSTHYFRDAHPYRSTRNSYYHWQGAKIQQNSEITKLSSKKELPPVTPLGTNRRGISKAAQTILAPRPFHQEDQPTVVPGRGNSLIRLALYLPRYPQMGLPLFLLAKIRRKIIIAKLVKNMNVAKNLKSAKQPFKKIFACAHARFVNIPENLPP